MTPVLAVLGLGTDGGQECADGDTLAAGVHLLWTMHSDLGFPSGGYDVWRRRHRSPQWVCLSFDQPDAPPPGVVSWTWLGFELAADPGPVEWREFGCGEQPGLHLPGVQTLLVRQPMGVVAVRGSGSGPLPMVEVLGAVDGRDVVVARQLADSAPKGRWAFELWAEGISGMRLIAESLTLCTLCFGIADETSGWQRLTPDPVLLPVVPPGTANDAANLDDPRATRALAGARLSGTLPPEVRARLADDFSGDARVAVEQLLRDGPGARLPAYPQVAAGTRTAPTLAMSTAALVAVAALDPDVSRMLGLLWHDPVPGGRWDYQVVAHHGSARYPSRTVDLTGLDPGPLPTDVLTRGEVSFVGTEGLEIVTAGDPWAGRPALRIARPRLGTVGGLYLATPAAATTTSTQAVTVRVAGAPYAVFDAWSGGTLVDSGALVLGEVTLQDGGGIDAVTWTGGPVDIVEVELFERGGPVEDQAAFAWDLGPQPPPPVQRLTITELAAATGPARQAPDGTVETATAVVGLDWTTVGAWDASRPVRVEVARALRGSAETPEPQGQYQVRTQARAAAAFARPRPADPTELPTWPGPAVPRRWIDRDQPASWSAWRIRGIDAFGRLGPWSAERLVDVRPAQVPPPPADITARHLDPADPYLPDADRALAADGPGLLVEWTWPTGRRLQAPYLEPSGEFRVYLRRGDPNLVRGTVTEVTSSTDRSRLSTDLHWPGAAGALAGVLLRLGGASFEVVANGSGEGTWFDVLHLTAPLRRPGTGPFTIRLTPADHGYLDLTSPRHFDRRLAVAAVGSLPVRTTRLATLTADAAGAEVTLVDPLPVFGADILPGLLVSRGAAYRVSEQTSGGSALRIAAAAQVDGSPLLPAPGDPGTVWTGGRFRAWLPQIQLHPAADEAMALALVTVTSADGDPGVADDPLWSGPGRGGLGGRPGREGPAGAVVRVTVPRRTPPPALDVARPPEQDGDIPAVPAEPADWYGRAHAGVEFAGSPGAAGYRVLRTSAAALFAHDQSLRRDANPPYTTGPFSDGGASQAWLAEHYPTLAVGDLTADPATLADPALVLAAWRDWAAWYYPALLNRQVMDLADLDSHQLPFQPAHPGTVAAPPFRDTVDGRGLGRFLYRIRTVDASGNAGGWSRTLPIVEVRDVTPPAMPVLLSTFGDENAVVLTWQVGGEPDLSGYRIWRAGTRAALADVRRRPTHAELPAVTGQLAQTWRDEGLTALVTWCYRVAAVDGAGNVSEPTAVVAARPVDTYPPEPPQWVRAERDPATGPPAVALEWTTGETGVVCRVERRLSRERIFTARTGWLGPADGATSFAWRDEEVARTVEATYRIRARDAAGNEQRLVWNPVIVPPGEAAR
jgi:hypothetical protein